MCIPEFAVTDPKITDEIRALIRRMAEENAGGGAPKIHGELLKLGFNVSERTVARYLRRIGRRGDQGKKWPAFMNNHREVIVAFDFFAVPTVTFQSPYCFFVIEARSPTDRTLQRHPLSKCGVGVAATA